jgi:hypothetical protein
VSGLAGLTREDSRGWHTGAGLDWFLCRYSDAAVFVSCRLDEALSDVQDQLMETYQREHYKPKRPAQMF